MSEYYLCPKCKRVPVENPGDKCEACQRKADEQDARYESAIKNQGKKPHNWRDALGWIGRRR